MFLLFSLAVNAADWCSSEDEQVIHTVNALISMTDSKDCDEAFKRLKKQKSLDLSNKEIQTIAPLQEFDFRVLLLRNNRITDISHLKEQRQLKWLDLSYNPIDSLDVIASLSDLETLWLEGVFLPESALEYDVLCQNKIRHLSLRGAGIKSVEHLKNCKDLVFLGVANNRIQDLSPLEGLKKISSIDLERNPIAVCPESAVPDILSKCMSALKTREINKD